MLPMMALVLLLTAPHQLVVAQGKADDPAWLEQYRAAATEKWEATIAKLEEQDRSTPDPEDAILFIGSSSIRLWTDLAVDMSPRKTINRGYGGAKFSDLAVYVDRIVNPHRFKALVIFVGNDIVGKPDDKSPVEVAKIFRYIVDRIRKTHPTQPIFLIAVTPTPSRFKAWPEIRQANAELAKVCQADQSLHFIATEEHYLDAEGNPIEKYFVEDKLHQNREGYKVWGHIIRTQLDRVLGPTE